MNDSLVARVAALKTSPTPDLKQRICFSDRTTAL